MAKNVRNKPETSYDIVWHSRPVLERMLEPKKVALIGATEAAGSVGLTLMENLMDPAFKGAVYPVNPKRATVLGVPAFPDVTKVPGPIDLAVICTPAGTVPNLISDCVKAGVPGAVVVSSGFKESGAKGIELEMRILDRARAGNMRIMGPNCLGVMIPRVGLNATFAKPLARAGSVAFLSQSGALCSAMLDWSLSNDVGFSAFISIGSMLDVDWGDLIQYLGDDPHTKTIVIYMETIGDARAFLSAAREVALSKPIIVLKVGKTPEASKAAASHTGSMTGADDVLDAAFKRVGVLRVGSISELFNLVHVLGKQPMPKGPRMAIVTNAGGPAALCTDVLIMEGCRLAELSKESLEIFDNALPHLWSRGNPIDILSDADEFRYALAVDTAMKDPGVDGVLVIMTPQAVSHSVEICKELTKLTFPTDKPILGSLMGGEQTKAGVAILRTARIPTFPYADTAVRAFASMWKYTENLRSIYETPALTIESDGFDIDRSYVTMILESARNSGRQILSELESKIILAAYGIPISTTHVADTERDAIELAKKAGGPVVLKVHSKTITHKTDVGGVRLNLRTELEVSQAWHSIRNSVLANATEDDFLGVTVQPMVALAGYELILGSSIDPQFGPVLLFGTGGQLTEIFKDLALGLPPLNATLARRMIEQTKIFEALKGIRGRKPVDLAKLADVLVRFSYLVVEQPWIKEIEINPLLCGAESIMALDARILLHDPLMEIQDLPKIAIRPYPNQYVSEVKMSDGSTAIVRPIRPEDEPLMTDFHRDLSQSTVLQRYFSVLQYEKRVSHDRLTRICFADYGTEIPLVVETKDSTGKRQLRGVARLNRHHGSDQARFAIVIEDEYQGKGLGKELLKVLIRVGRAEKLKSITGIMLEENAAMRHVCEQLGFALTFDSANSEWHAVMNL